MINTIREFNQISENPDLFLFEMKICLDLNKKIFQDHMLSHSVYSLRFYRERKWHTLPWRDGEDKFDTSQFYLYEEYFQNFKNDTYLMVTDPEADFTYTPMSYYEKFFIYLSPEYFHYYLASALQRKDLNRLEWLQWMVENGAQYVYDTLQPFLRKYNVKIPKAWIMEHPLHNNLELLDILQARLNTIHRYAPKEPQYFEVYPYKGLW